MSGRSLVMALLPLILAASALAAAKKLAIPDAAALKNEASVISDIYRTDLAKAVTAQQQVDLSKKMMQDGLQTKNDPVGRYAVFSRAASLAAQAGDIPSAFEAIDFLNAEYEIDTLKLKVDLAVSAIKPKREKDSLANTVNNLLPLIDDAVAIDRYDIARSGADTAMSAARRAADANLLSRATLYYNKVQACSNSFERLKPDLATLLQKPSDPPANLSVGQFKCFLKADWAGGLPMLALGNDAALKALAADDLKGATNADQRLAIGDAWWAFADKESPPAKRQILTHASKWYSLALPELTGLAKARIESRLESLGHEIEQPTPKSTVLTLDSRNTDWSSMGILAKGKYTIEITGKIHLHFDEPVFITGPQGKDYGGHMLGTVSVKVDGKFYSSLENGRDIEGGRAIDIELSDVSKALMKVNDEVYNDNSGSYTIKIIPHN